MKGPNAKCRNRLNVRTYLTAVRNLVTIAFVSKITQSRAAVSEEVRAISLCPYFIPKSSRAVKFLDLIRTNAFAFSTLEAC
jgi:hypothetical protein